MPPIMVVSLDGVPEWFIREAVETGLMPNLASLAKQGAFGRMRSTIPAVSCTAWASFQTMTNPGGHGIYGFTDRIPNPFRTIIPTGREMQAETIVKRISREGGRVLSINVPMTTPPFPVNGYLVSGFLSVRLERATYPAGLAERLARLGYVVDPDPKLAAADREAFWKAITEAYRGRISAAGELLKEGPYDFIHLHIMETDRIGHFFWKDLVLGIEPFASRIRDFFRVMDSDILRLVESAGDLELILLSDHGFCPVKRQVNINAVLIEKGILSMEDASARRLEGMSGQARAYSMIPGRIYVNLEGREEKGGVGREDFDAVREEVTEVLLSITDPETGERVIREVHRGEDIFSGPAASRAPDLVAVPEPGYDLKAAVPPRGVFTESHIVGMHTDDDAFFISPGASTVPEKVEDVLKPYFGRPGS